MIRIGKYIKNRNGYVSFYRCNGPFLRLEKQYDNIEFVNFDQPTGDWSRLMNLDIMFMHLPNSVDSLEFILMCKAMNVKVWVDYDDNLFEVNYDHAYAAKINPRKKVIEKILQAADFISVSTDYLKETYSPYNENIIVIPNALDLDLFKGEPVPAKHNFITWRGGEGHAYDLMSVQNAIQDVAKNSSDWVFNFMGYNPHFIRIENKVHYPATDIITYLNHLHTLSSKIHIVPLCDNPYNRSKSNIAWMEATFCGSLVIAPRFDEFNKPGIILYESEKIFKEALEFCMQDINDTNKNLVNYSWEYIKNNLSLSKINKLRCDVIKHLTKATMHSTKSQDRRDPHLQ